MGLLTKQYLRYIDGSIFGVIATGRCLCFVTRFNEPGKYIAASACENVIIWDMKKKIKVLTLNSEIHSMVTAISARPANKNTLDNTHIAVGYSNGMLALFDTRLGQAVNFNGHRGGISSISWDSEGMRIASGSEDGEIVVWDVVSERGIVRLLGHKGRINRIHFMKNHNIIMTSCRDTYVKFWDLDTNHCFKTFAPFQSEVLDFVIVKNDTRLITGISNEGLHVWNLDFKTKMANKEKVEDDVVDSSKEPTNKIFVVDTDGEKKFKIIDGTDEVDDENAIIEITEMGKIVRSKDDRICGLISDGRTIVCHGKSSVVDMYMVLDDDEIAAKKEKKLKKLRKRAREDPLNAADIQLDNVELSFEIRKIPAFKALSRINGISLFTLSEGVIRVATLHIDNSIAMYATDIGARKKKLNADSIQGCAQISSICRPGHRSEVRCVSFNSIGDQVISASGDSIKVWHRAKGEVVTSIDSDYALSLILPPGDRHALIGTKSGFLQLFDLGTGQLLENVQAHVKNKNDNDNGVWALSLTSDGRGFVSGGSDSLVKFWSFELVSDSDSGSGKRLSFIQDSRALKVADAITCIRCSADGKLLAVATLDLKETIYFMDTLKLLHELYGKSLPATCMDFSSDATMLATGSVDSIVRIFGTDFGDQRKMLKNAHEGGVNDLKFISKTHLFFTCGNDGSIKQWDGDKFERIITLSGHFGTARCIAVCPKGIWTVSCGKDRTLRLWERSNEPLILDEEREEERRRKSEAAEIGAFQRPVVLGESNVGAVRPTKTTIESEKAADQLLEAICIFRDQVIAGKTSTPHQLMTLVYKTDDPYKFVLLVLRKIKSSELEEAILMLPLNRVLELLLVLKGIINRDWAVELSTRVLVVALRTNLTQLATSQQALPILRTLSKIVPEKLKLLQNTVGFNLAGLHYLRMKFEDRNEAKLFAEAALKVKDSRRKRRNKERTMKRVILTI